ncbi:MAG: hypothetical protein PVF49_11495 [Anaerolineales bacterium]|jgi:hypothetical protein
MSEPVIFEEKVYSKWTTVLFIALTVVCSTLAIWRIASHGLDFLGSLATILAVMFLFYVLNYQTLVIHLTPQSLALKFGLFSYKIPLENIQDCQLDDPPWFYKYGGAGIHFYLLRGRYRASFNFLEFPRVAISLRQKAGLVKEISFTTRQPDKIIQLIQQVRSQV